MPYRPITSELCDYLGSLKKFLVEFLQHSYNCKYRLKKFTYSSNILSRIKQIIPREKRSMLT